MCCRLRQELLKVLKQVGRATEQGGNLAIDFLNRLLLTLVRLQDLEKLLVDLGLVLEAVLDFVDVGDGMVELDRAAFLAAALLRGGTVGASVGGRGVCVPRHRGLLRRLAGGAATRTAVETSLVSPRTIEHGRACTTVAKRTTGAL